MKTTRRILHTSDIHLNEEWTIGVLEAIVDLAQSQNVDVLLLAGDVFDDSRVADVVLDGAVAQLARLTMPIIVIPGNHDCLDDRSIFQRVDLTTAGPHVTFIDDPKGRRVNLEQVGISIWARAMEAHVPTNRPLEGFEPGPPGYWDIAMAHGHYAVKELDLLRSSPIRPEEIAGLSCDYLALGHWHRSFDPPDGDVIASYCGSPTPGETATPTVNLVTLDPTDGVSVIRVALDHPGVPVAT